MSLSSCQWARKKKEKLPVIRTKACMNKDRGWVGLNTDIERFGQSRMRGGGAGKLILCGVFRKGNWCNKSDFCFSAPASSDIQQYLLLIFAASQQLCWGACQREGTLWILTSSFCSIRTHVLILSTTEVSNRKPLYSGLIFTDAQIVACGLLLRSGGETPGPSGQEDVPSFPPCCRRDADVCDCYSSV